MITENPSLELLKSVFSNICLLLQDIVIVFMAAGGLVGFPVSTSGLQPTLYQLRTQAWMLAIQHELEHNRVVEADYNGSNSDYQYIQTGVNRFPGGLPFTDLAGAPFVPIPNSSNQVIGSAGGDYNAEGSNYHVPNAPSFGNNLSTNRTDFINGFAQASAFPTPALEQQGRLGRNTFTGPGMANVNSEFAKDVKNMWSTPEGANLELRADIFNLFDLVNLTNPVSDLSSSLFGRSLSRNLPRPVQLGIHMDF